MLACSPVLLTRRQCQAQLPVTTVSSEAPQCQGNTNGFPTSPFPGRSTSAHTRAFWLPHISLPSLLCGAARYRPPWRAACMSLSTRACHTAASQDGQTCIWHLPGTSACPLGSSVRAQPSSTSTDTEGQGNTDSG